MDKRALSAIPRPALTDKNKEMKLLVSNMSYLVTAARREISGNDTLIINFFKAEKGRLYPKFRTFCQMDDYISQDLTTDKTRWKTGAVNYLTGYVYWHRDNGNIVIASLEERQEVLDFLSDFRKRHGIEDHKKAVPQGTVVDNEVGSGIDEYQDTIKEWRLRKKHAKEKAEIDLQMERFGALPDDYGRFVEEKVFDEDNFIFYSKAKSMAFCTKCGHEFRIRKDGMYHKEIGVWNDTDLIKHNRAVRCPYCNKHLICKSEGMGRKRLFAVRWSVLVQRSEKNVLVRYFMHTKDFQRDLRRPKIETAELYRSVHSAEKMKDYEWGRFKNTDEFRWCAYRKRGYGCFTPPETMVPRSAVLYNEDISQAVAESCMRYSAVDIYLDKVAGSSRRLDRPWTIDWYFNVYRKKPYLEQLLKIGFYEIARSVLEGYEHVGLKNGRTIMEILGVNKTQFNMLRRIGDPSMRDVRILQYAGEIRWEDLEMLRHLHADRYDRTYEKYLDMRRYTTIYKVIRYINRQKIWHETDYFDYVRWLEEMGYDMRSGFNLYPKDFRKAHDERSKEYARFKDAQAREDIRRFNKLLKKFRNDPSDTDAINLKIGGLFIRLPEQLDELKKEGEVLHHCVGTYIDRVARGETMIFFIRREADPDRPFFTLEWKDRVIQCRGYKNCDMTPEVKAFVSVFQEKMMEYGNEPKKRRKAG